MAYQENDISWNVLREIVRDWAGSTAELAEVTPLDGGSISTTLRLTAGDGEKAVLKISPYRVDRSYQIEATNLQLLRSIGIPVPVVYQSVVGTLDNPNSYLLMEFVNGFDLSAAKRHCSPEDFEDLQHHLAELVVAMHTCVGSGYGRVAGDESMDSQSWCTFFRDVHEATLQEIRKMESIPIKARKVIGKVHERLDRLIAHGDVPRLVHWDLWSGNLLCAPNEKGKMCIAAILDPVCKYAHAECELAYLDLFHTSTPVFNRVYHQHFPLDDNYHHLRKPVYQMYPLLNHVCMFGAEYVKPLLTLVEQLGRIV